MSDIPFQSKKIEGELDYLDATTATRLFEHYDGCSADGKFDFVAALIAALLVSRARCRGDAGA
ncbi:hypothetical protein [Stenotrophomonas sp. CFBP 13725]|uniref:hypothetical protein n=1 Tax=Stenotrophomonas sp. CFBP 13725 TaxID=2775297 RepID=UPI001782599C|nr:hypothetical protein [Stenotrophomonas sp. CFBP 13725]MBD8634756.1 hypothetical protein [Stenotrophomonas sp. CFBP 13725]